MTKGDWIDEYIQEILKRQKILDTIRGDTVGLKVRRIQILSEILVFIGKLAAEFSARYKQLQFERKQAYAKAYKAAVKNKAIEADIAVAEIQAEELKVYKYMKKFTYGFETTREEINALKYSVKIDFEDGSSRMK